MTARTKARASDRVAAFTSGLSVTPPVPPRSVHAVRSTGKYRQPLALAAHRVEDVDPVLRAAVVARDLDDVLGRSDVQAGHGHRAEDAPLLGLAGERRRRDGDGSAHTLVAQAEVPAFALHLRAGRQQDGVGAIAVAGGDDALLVDARAKRVAEQGVERKAQVLRAGNGLGVLGRILQAADQAEEVASPQAAVAAHSCRCRLATPLPAKCWPRSL